MVNPSEGQVDGILFQACSFLGFDSNGSDRMSATAGIDSNEWDSAEWPAKDSPLALQ